MIRTSEMHYWRRCISVIRLDKFRNEEIRRRLEEVETVWESDKEKASMVRTSSVDRR